MTLRKLNNYTHPIQGCVFYVNLGSWAELTNRILVKHPIVQFFILKAQPSIVNSIFPKRCGKPQKGSPGNAATRPSKLDITGNFFRSSDRFFGFPIFSRKLHDPALKNFIFKSIRFWHIYLSKSLSRISLHLTTFLVRNFLLGPH